MVRSQCGATARLEPGLVPRQRVKVCSGNERRTLMGPAPCLLPMAVSGIPVLPRRQVRFLAAPKLTHGHDPRGTASLEVIRWQIVTGSPPRTIA